MYRLSNAPCIRPVTPKESENDFLSINNFPGQRDLNPAKARAYADGLNDGSFRCAPIDIATGPNGVKYLMNGQHTCTAIVIHGKPVKCIVSHYICETEDDLWRLFATFDVHATRTQGQIFKGARPFLKDERLHGLPLRVLAACGSALAIIGDKGKPNFNKHSALSKTPKVEAVNTHSDEVIWVNAFLNRSTDHMLRVGVIAAMIATRRANKELAFSFWKLVADGIGVTSKDSPAYKLREKLIHSGWTANNTRNNHFVTYSICVTWWNCYVTGEKRNGVKVQAMKEAPVVLAPTKKQELKLAA
jgi:hypothetical protein